MFHFILILLLKIHLRLAKISSYTNEVTILMNKKANISSEMTITVIDLGSKCTIFDWHVSRPRVKVSLFALGIVLDHLFLGYLSLKLSIQVSLGFSIEVAREQRQVFRCKNLNPEGGPRHFRSDSKVDSFQPSTTLHIHL
jgi:hypothetical protein